MKSRAGRVLSLLVVLALVAMPSAKEPACEFDGISRVVAVGDVHGAYDSLVRILRAAGITNERDRWAGGKTHFVQVGDVLDRGPDSRKVLDLYKRLEREASSAGGRVHFLLGNHEAMRLRGSLAYTSAGEYQAFATPESESVRRAVVAEQSPAVRKQIMDAPLGMIELMHAFGPDEEYGAYLRTLNTVVRINGVVFVHGGISPATAALSCGEINKTVRRELTEDLAKTNALPLEASLSTREDGPLWYRGLATEPDTFQPQVDAILAAQHARAIVVGHTPRGQGTIGSRFGAKVFLIDTGMLTSYVRRGQASALEMVGDAFTAIYVDSRGPVGEAGPVVLAGDASQPAEPANSIKP